MSSSSVSVIIPTYNGKRLLEKNLPSVLLALRPDDELVIVDDASLDDTVKWMVEEYKLTPLDESPVNTIAWSGKIGDVQTVLLQNTKNQRFAESCNRGVRAARHDIVVLLNSDVVPTQGFLFSLYTHFQDPSVFAVGCKEIATTEGNKEYGRAGGKFVRGFLIHWREKDQNGTDTLWVSGGSGAFRRSMWEELGGFDTDYRPAYWEDIDLSWRARKRGWKILFDPQSIVHHNHETTNASVFGAKRMEVMAYKNQILFMWKNAPARELFLHFLWLPYHLVFTTLRSEGRFCFGLLKALQSMLE